jgi:sugar lactone lactonase YvrE
MNTMPIMVVSASVDIDRSQIDLLTIVEFNKLIQINSSVVTLANSQILNNLLNKNIINYYVNNGTLTNGPLSDAVPYNGLATSILSNYYVIYIHINNIYFKQYRDNVLALAQQIRDTLDIRGKNMVIISNDSTFKVQMSQLLEFNYSPPTSTNTDNSDDISLGLEQDIINFTILSNAKYIYQFTELNTSILCDRECLPYYNTCMPSYVCQQPVSEVITIAGSPGIHSLVNAVGMNSTFNLPGALTVDSSGNVYVADTSNNIIRKITPSGVVTSVGTATLDSPNGITVDSSGNLYVSDTSNNIIRKITPSGIITSLATLDSPNGITVDSSGNVYVANTGAHTINQIDDLGTISVIAGTQGAIGYTDGTAGAASFNLPQGIARDISGNLYVADTGNHLIRKITPGNIVSTLAGSVGVAGSANGTGIAATFSSPKGITVDTSGNVYVADTGNSLIRKITPLGVVTTFAGNGTVGYLDGLLLNSKFNLPQGIAIDLSGNLYVADTGNSLIRELVSVNYIKAYYLNYSTIALSLFNKYEPILEKVQMIPRQNIYIAPPAGVSYMLGPTLSNNYVNNCGCNYINNCGCNYVNNCGCN